MCEIVDRYDDVNRYVMPHVLLTCMRIDFRALFEARWVMIELIVDRRLCSGVVEQEI
jgi:hypothetical protein